MTGVVSGARVCGNTMLSEGGNNDRQHAKEDRGPERGAPRATERATWNIHGITSRAINLSAATGGHLRHLLVCIHALKGEMSDCWGFP